MSKIIISRAKTYEELRDVFAIRKKVFVDEQKMFDDTDIDQYDEISQYLIARSNGSIIGTVRVFPDKDDEWIGGRLAVRKKYRGSYAATLLVKEAVKLVAAKECKRFTAAIQKQNVEFFRRLNWRPVGNSFMLKGVCHQIMEADLDRR